MDDVRCPNCGKENPADQDLCQFCYSKLKPTDDLPLSANDDLMSLLGSQDEEEDVPDWLRDLSPAEQASPFSDEDEAEESAYEMDFLQEEAEAAREPEASDTGEKPFSENETEVDWLGELADDSASFHLDLDEGELAAGEEKAEEGTPGEPTLEETLDWLSSLDSQSPDSSAQAEPPDFLESGEEGTDIDWSSLVEEPDWLQPSGETTDSEPGEPGAEEDWLSSLEAEFGATAPQEPEEEAPTFDFQSSAPATSEEEQPDWLSRLGPQTLPDEDHETVDRTLPDEGEEELEFTLQDLEDQPTSMDWSNIQEDDLGEQPDWIASLEGESPEPEQGGEESAEAEPEEKLSASAFTDGFSTFGESEADQGADWFSQLESDASEEEQAEPAPPEEVASISPFTEDVDEFLEGEAAPDWFSSTEEQPAQRQTAPDEDIPDWLRDAGEGVSPFGAFQEAAAPMLDGSQVSEQAGAPEEALTPDWFADAFEEYPETEQPAAETSFASFETDEEEVPDWLANLERGATETPETGSTPAFVLDEELPPFGGEEPSGEPVPTMFGETPDWLDQISGSQELPPIEAREPEAQDEEELAPAELPGWLEAMRPSEGAVPFRDTSDDRVENQGVLAGLPGILAAEYDLEQVAKPPTYSNKLQVPQDQQQRLDLLKSLLAEEEQAAPAPKSTALPTTYILRLIILGAFILGAIFAFWVGAQQTPPPGASAIPQAVIDLNTTVINLPENAPVLIAFDYQAGSIPELEAASLGVVDKLLAKGSIIRTVSTNNIGPALAKRMLDQALATPDQPQAQPNIAHLGYIPGGPSGLQAFGRDPAGLMHYDIQSTESGEMNAWQAPNFKPEDGLANFALVMVITDNGESARSWIEQVGPTLLANQVPMVMVLSAQIEPMVLPYYYTAPRQVTGIATGVMGGVFLENLNGTSGPAGTLMDAYSLSLSVAVVLLLIGSLVYLISGQLKNIKNLRIEGQA